jgi:DNA-binding XRE family transcriptional regulator
MAQERRTELKVARVRMDLSQERAAERIGIERRVLMRAERGGGLSLEHALKIAAFYGRPVEELFGDLLEQAA